MSKQITPAELATIVSTLLVRPELLGELDSATSHSRFMLEIGQVVADHCGGIANWVNEGQPDIADGGDTSARNLTDSEVCPLLSVSPDDSLPSLNRNVWAAYDLTGWEGEEENLGELGIELGEPLSERELVELRGAMKAVLLDDTYTVPFELPDAAGYILPSVRGDITVSKQGILCRFDGYSDAVSADDIGVPVMIEHYDQEINVRLYADIDTDEPTHFVPLTKARNKTLKTA